MIAVEPLSYREILALVLGGRRPNVRAKAVAPHDLEGEVARRGPCVVVCDRLTPGVKEMALSWVHLLPPELGDSVVCIGQRRHYSRIKDVCIDDLLAVVDSTEELISGTPVPGSCG